MKALIKVDGGLNDQSRPKERPPKTNWKIELLKKLLVVYQYIAPKRTAELIWERSTRPGRSKFNKKQQELVDEANITPIEYKGHKVYHYRWGNSEYKVMLSHGWNSKIADFRKMIRALVKAGYQVEGIDMKAHGKSEGKQTVLPEMVEILVNHHKIHGPYYAAIGYSIGGLAAGITIHELPSELRPKHYIKIAAPPFTRFFYEEIVKDLGFRHKVYEKVVDMFSEHYSHPIDYFDLRDKISSLNDLKIMLIYDEDDQTIKLERGLSFAEQIPDVTFVQSSGLGHYQVIANDEINQRIIEQLELGKNMSNLSVA